MFVYFFDPSYTSAEMLRHIASALKVRKVFSMMRVEDLTEDLLNLHNSSFVNFWSPSTEDKYEVAFKEVARKIFPIISYPWFMDGKLMGYMSKGGTSIKNRPIYSLAMCEEPSCEFGVTVNIMVLRRRSFNINCLRHIIPEQSPQGAIFRYVTTCLKNQDLSKISADSPMKRQASTTDFLDNVLWTTIPSSLDDLFEKAKTISSGEYKERRNFGENGNICLLPIADGLTHREILAFNEMRVFDYIQTLGNRCSYMALFLINNFFLQYFVHILSEKIRNDAASVINKFMTEAGRAKYQQEEHWKDEVLKQDEEYREEMAREAAERENDRFYQQDLRNELDYIRNNGGDWIDD